MNVYGLEVEVNKNTVSQLVKRAYDTRLGEIKRIRQDAYKEINATEKVKELNKQITKLISARDRIVKAYVVPRQKKAEAEIEQLKKQYLALFTQLGCSITNEEKKVVITKLAKFLTSLPNCKDAQLLKP